MSFKNIERNEKKKITKIFLQCYEVCFTLKKCYEKKKQTRKEIKTFKKHVPMFVSDFRARYTNHSR